MSSTKLEDNATDIGNDLGKIREEIAKLSGTIGELLCKQADTTGDQVRAAISGARDSLSVATKSAQAPMSSVESDIEAKIIRNPVTAVLIAMAAGRVLGMSTQARK